MALPTRNLETSGDSKKEIIVLLYSTVRGWLLRAMVAYKKISQPDLKDQKAAVPKLRPGDKEALTSCVRSCGVFSKG